MTAIRLGLRKNIAQFSLLVPWPAIAAASILWLAWRRQAASQAVA